MLESVYAKLVDFGTVYGLKIIGAILLLIVGRIVAGIVRRSVRRAFARTKVDPTIASFTASLAYMLVLTFVVLAALNTFGIQTASFIAILGAAGFAIGFALQGSLANFASGVLILIFRPYKVGDFVSCAGATGVVQAIHLFNTEISTPDNIKVIVPNSQIYGTIIQNYSGYDKRRVDLVIGIGYASPMSMAMEIVMGFMREDEGILDDPAPQVAVSELADSSVNLVVRPWVIGEDYWDVRFDLTQKIKQAFDANGIEIPFPQRVVHMLNEGSESSGS